MEKMQVISILDNSIAQIDRFRSSLWKIMLEAHGTGEQNIVDECIGELKGLNHAISEIHLAQKRIRQNW